MSEMSVVSLGITGWDRAGSAEQRSTKSTHHARSEQPVLDRVECDGVEDVIEPGVDLGGEAVSMTHWR